MNEGAEDLERKEADESIDHLNNTGVYNFYAIVEEEDERSLASRSHKSSYQEI